MATVTGDYTSNFQASIIKTGIELRVEALEQSAQANEAALGEINAAIRTLSGELDGIRAIILWLAKQPWELDQATTWDDLVAKASAGQKKESRFRTEVVL